MACTVEWQSEQIAPGVSLARTQAALINEDSLYIFPYGTFTGLPANNETCVIGATTYRFRTVLAAAYDVLIGASAAATAANFNDAINDIVANEGTTYGTGTAAHPTVTSTVVSATVTLSADVSLSEVLANFLWFRQRLTYYDNWAGTYLRVQRGVFSGCTVAGGGGGAGISPRAVFY